MPRQTTKAGPRKKVKSEPRKVFTTGQVAKLIKVAPRTVAKWFDQGRLRGYRIPGSQDRRIPRKHLMRFLKDHGMDCFLKILEAEMHRFLVVDRSLRVAPADPWTALPKALETAMKEHVPEAELTLCIGTFGTDDFLKIFEMETDCPMNHSRFLVIACYLEVAPADPWTALPSALATALRKHVPRAEITLVTDTFEAGVELQSGSYETCIFLLPDDLDGEE